MKINRIKEEDVRHLFSKRMVEANKGDFKKVGILGGSLKYSGAVKLASMSLSSLRSGCGLSRIIVPKNIAYSLTPFILEQTIYPYKSLKDIKMAISDLECLALGMGWDKEKQNLKILTFILINFKGKVIIDADGLNTLVNHLELLEKSKAKIILTPHLKEFSRLINVSLEKLEKEKEELAFNFAKKYHVILVLKGHSTIITDGSLLYLCECGSPGMATSGSGDVLSGILAGMLAYQDYNLLTVSAGVLLNGLAGELATRKNTDIGMLASDTIKNIPDAIQKIRNNVVNVQNFFDLDIRVGTIIWVDDFLKAKKKAYKLEIDFGVLGVKKSSAQITTFYQKEDLIGKQVLAIVNFSPKQVADFMSEVLVLGIYHENGVILISPDKPVCNGDKLG